MHRIDQSHADIVQWQNTALVMRKPQFDPECRHREHELDEESGPRRYASTSKGSLSVLVMKLDIIRAYEAWLGGSNPSEDATCARLLTDRMRASEARDVDSTSTERATTVLDARLDRAPLS